MDEFLIPLIPFWLMFDRVPFAKKERRTPLNGGSRDFIFVPFFSISGTYPKIARLNVFLLITKLYERLVFLLILTRNKGYVMKDTGDTSRSGFAAPTVESLVDQNQPPQPIDVSGKSSTPTLLIMAGFAGAGKTTLAQRLHRDLGWRVLDKDAIQRSFLATGVAKNLAGWNAFEQLLELTQQTLSQGESVIVDTSNERPFVFERTMHILKQMCHEQHVCPNYMVLFCIASQQVREKRLNIRGSSFAPYHKELPLVLPDSQLRQRLGHLLPLKYQSLLERFHLPGCFPRPILHQANALFIDTDRPLEEYAKPVLEMIQSSAGINLSLAQ